MANQTTRVTLDFPNPSIQEGVGRISPAAEATPLEWNEGGFRRNSDPATMATGLWGWWCDTGGGTPGTWRTIQIVGSVGAGTNISITGTAKDPIVNVTGVVLSVSAGTNVSVTGTATNPIVNVTGVVTSVSAGTGISITGTSAAPIVNNTGVLSVSAGTGVTITGTAANPIVNATGTGGVVVSISAGPGISVTGTATVPIINNLLVLGLGGGQTVIGGTAASETLTLLGSADAANGSVIVPGHAGIVSFKVSLGTLWSVGNVAVGSGSGSNGVSVVPASTGASIWDFTGAGTEMLRFNFTAATVVIPSAVTRLEGGAYVTSSGGAGFAPTRQAMLIDRATTLVSGASARLDYLRVDPASITVTGTTNITGANVVGSYFTPPILNGAGAASVVVSQAVTLEIAGPPIGVAGVTVSAAYAFKATGATWFTAGTMDIGTANGALLLNVNGTGSATPNIGLSPGSTVTTVPDGGGTAGLNVTPNTINVARPMSVGAVLYGTYYGQYTYVATGASGTALALAGSATVHIAGPPILSGLWASSNIPSALYVASGNTQIQGTFNVGGNGIALAFSAVGGGSPTVGFFTNPVTQQALTGVASAVTDANAKTCLQSIGNLLSSYGLSSSNFT